MKKIVSIIFLSLLFFSFFIVPVNAGLVPCGLSEDDPDQPGDQTEDCTLCHFFVMIDNWIDGLLFMIVPPLAVLMIAIGGGTYIVSQGNPEMLGRAKKLFTAVVIGLLIIYGAYVIIGLFLMTIGLADGTQGGPNWYDIYKSWWKEGLFEIPCP